MRYGREWPDELAALAALAGLISAADAAVVLRGESSPDGFGDGAAYRAMARGEPGAPPFQRRVLMPALVRGLQGDDRLSGFRAVALSAVAAGAIGTGLLGARVARSCGVGRSEARLAGVLSGALVPAMPHSTRMAVQMPVFNDQLSVAAGALWLLLGPSRRHPLASPAALAAGLTREQWILVVGTVLPLLGRSRPVLAAHLAALAIATGVVLAQPAGPGSEVYPPRLALRRLASREGFVEVLWGLGFANGLLPVLLPAALRRVRGRCADRPTLAALLRVVAAQTALALVGGSDTPRLVHGALPFLTAATVGVAVAEGDRRLAPVLAGTLAGWRPLTRLAGSARAYEEFYLPFMHGLLRRRVAADVARVLGALAVVAAAQRMALGASRQGR